MLGSFETIDLLGSSKPIRKLSLFFSSTFTDSWSERNVLFEKILPNLQKKHRVDRIQISFSDMRFGIKDESTKNNLAAALCFEEILHCYKETNPDCVFFVSLQGDKYGYRPLPQQIWKKNFKDHLQQKKNEGKDDYCLVLQEFYKLNENSVPQVYELYKREEDKEALLVKELNLSFDSKNPELETNSSITEWEFLYASKLDSKRCLWVQRTFEDVATCLKDYDTKHFKDLFDTVGNPELQSKLQDLKNLMEDRLPNRVCNDLPQLSPINYLLKDELDWEAYIAKWETSMETFVEIEVQKILVQQKEWELDGRGVGIEGNYLDELIHHFRFADGKAKNFLERKELVAEGLSKILTGSPISEQNGLFQAVSLCVTGNSGSGKTSFMAKLASEFLWKKKIPVIIRFCGTSEFSVNILNLIQYICIELLYVYNEKEKLTSFIEAVPHQTLTKVIQDFREFVKQYPVYLFIDSLDQLSTTANGGDLLLFLKNLKDIPKETRIIVSTLPNDWDKAKSQKSSWLLLNLQTQPTIEVKSLLENGKPSEEESVKRIVTELLKGRNRSITNDQLTKVFKAVSQEPTVLYVNLSLYFLCKWNSYDDINQNSLTPTASALITQIFEDLEITYGKKLTETAFAFITFSRGGNTIHLRFLFHFLILIFERFSSFGLLGVSDLEMQDLLSLSKGVLLETFQYFKLDTLRLPFHVWRRLKDAIRHLIIEKSSYCIQWYHRQLWETAEIRYDHLKTEVHQIMGKYFGGRIEPNVMSKRAIHSNPLILNDSPIWYESAEINVRRVFETCFHYVHGGLYEWAIEEICSFEIICAVALIGDGFNFLQLVDLLCGKCTTTVQDIQLLNLLSRLTEYFHWLRKQLNTILVDPRQKIPSTASAEPSCSMVKKEFLRYLSVCERKGINWLKEITLNGVNSPNGLQLILAGHTEEVFAIAWSNDSTRVASGSGDGKVKIWDGETGELCFTLEGHSSVVKCLAWNSDGTKLVSGGMEIIIWCTITGQLLSSPKLPAACLKMLPDGIPSEVKRNLVWYSPDSKLVSGGKEGITCCGETVQSPSISKADFNSLSWYKNEILICYSVLTTNHVQKVNEDSLESFEVKVSKRVHILNEDNLEGFETKVSNNLCKSIRSVWSGDGDGDGAKVLLVNGVDIFLFDRTLTKTLLSIPAAHNDSINCVTWTPDDNRFITGSEDYEVKIWSIHGTLTRTINFGKRKAVCSVSCNHDGNQLLVGVRPGGGGELNILDLNTGDRIKQLICHDGGNIVGQWSKDGSKIASCSWDVMVRIWKADSENRVNNNNGHSAPIKCVAFSPDGSQIASGSKDNVVKIWDATTHETTHKVIHTFSKKSHPDSRGINSVAWHPNGKFIVSSSVYSIEVWNLDSPTMEKSYTGHLMNSGSKQQVPFVNAVAFSPDGLKIASGSSDETVKIWDFSPTSVTIKKTLIHDAEVRMLAWNKNSDKIVSITSQWLIACGTVYIWDATTGICLSTIENQWKKTSFISWTADESKVIACSGSNTFCMWDGTLKQQIGSFTGHSDEIYCVSFDPKGKRIASCGKDKKVIIWEADTGKVLHCFEGNSGWVNRVEWSSDGKKVVACSDDKMIKIWEIPRVSYPNNRKRSQDFENERAKQPRKLP
jgi:WD40 repeat protein/Cdc6-like AAA superfamily ATPase